MNTFKQLLDTVIRVDTSGTVSDIAEAFSKFKIGATVKSNAITAVVNEFKASKLSSASLSVGEDLDELLDEMEDSCENAVDQAVQAPAEEIFNRMCERLFESKFAMEGWVDQPTLRPNKWVTFTDYQGYPVVIFRAMKSDYTDHYQIKALITDQTPEELFVGDWSNRQDGMVLAECYTGVKPSDPPFVYRYTADAAYVPQYLGGKLVADARVSWQALMDDLDDRLANNELLQSLMSSSFTTGHLDVAQALAILDNYTNCSIVPNVREYLSSLSLDGSCDILAILSIVNSSSTGTYDEGSAYYKPNSNAGYTTSIVGFIVSALVMVVGVVLSIIFKAFGFILSAIATVLSFVFSSVLPNIDKTSASIDHYDETPTFNRYGMTFEGVWPENWFSTHLSPSIGMLMDDTAAVGYMSTESFTPAFWVANEDERTAFMQFVIDGLPHETVSYGFTVVVGQGSDHSVPITITMDQSSTYRQTVGSDWITMDDDRRRSSVLSQIDGWAAIALKQYFNAAGITSKTLYVKRADFDGGYFFKKTARRAWDDARDGITFYLDANITQPIHQAQAIAAYVALRAYRLQMIQDGEPDFPKDSWDDLTMIMNDDPIKHYYDALQVASFSGFAELYFAQCDAPDERSGSELPAFSFTNAAVSWPTVSRTALLTALITSALVATTAVAGTKLTKKKRKAKSLAKLTLAEQKFNAAKKRYGRKPTKENAAALTKANRKLAKARKKATKNGWTNYGNVGLSTVPPSSVPAYTEAVDALNDAASYADSQTSTTVVDAAGNTDQSIETIRRLITGM